MKNLFFNQFALFFLAVFIFTACKKEATFSVVGHVSGAEKKTMYLENVGTSKVTVLDSVNLQGGGKFSFKRPRPDGLDFYRLRLDGQLINFAIDSLETINIQADASNFARGYTVEGSVDCSKIKEMTLAQLKASDAYNQLQKLHNEKKISVDEYQQQLNVILDEYKTIAKKHIYGNPKSTVAYFALFQQINRLLIFDPYDKEDYKAFGAVATSWNQYYPESIRSKHLYTLVMQVLKTIRGERPVEYPVEDAIAHFDISLPDISGKMIDLMEAGKGKVVLLDFTASQMQDSPLHNTELSKVYEKYKNKGFEIYQVSLDTDEHLWKNAASNLPWICVRDPKSIYSQYAINYNVKELPTGFVISRMGEIVKRIDLFSTLENDLANYIK